MKFDPNMSLTGMVVVMQKTILQLTERVEALERKAAARPPRPPKPPSLTRAARITIEDAKVNLTPEGRDRLTLAMICQSVARAHELTVKDIRGPRKDRAATMARKEACKLMRAEGFSLQHIGSYMGNRNHTTIMHHAGERGRK